MNEAIQSISAIGTSIHVVGSVTFPNGFTVSNFADDSDPFAFDQQQIADYGIAFNGTLLTWDKATALPMNLNVVPNCEDDKNLRILFNANRRTKDHQPAGDIITMTKVYPDGTRVTLKNGKILTGKAVNDASSAGRFNSRNYGFVFQDAQ